VRCIRGQYLSRKEEAMETILFKRPGFVPIEGGESGKGAKPVMSEDGDIIS
jgi:hypothetical protein